MLMKNNGCLKKRLCFSHVRLKETNALPLLNYYLTLLNTFPSVLILLQYARSSKSRKNRHSSGVDIHRKLISEAFDSLYYVLEFLEVECGLRSKTIYRDKKLIFFQCILKLDVESDFPFFLFFPIFLF